ncbi:MAG: hypothetical protein FJ267_12080, partial [Planctomycetes bacterium]|nr:hypothetical protein [Planctomycetota bacterium]
MTSDITSRLLKSVASRHFATRTRQSLMSRIGSFVTSSNLTKQDLVEAFGSRSRPVLHLAWQKLVQFSPEELNRFIEDCLRLDSADKLLAAPALLRSVSRESIQLSNKNLATIRMLVESHNPEIRVAAASCLALRASDLVVEFVRSDALIEPELLRSFCLAEDDRLIIPLMKRFGFPERNPPPMIGCCINPEWLAEHQSEEPVFVEWLAFHCGYCDELSSLQVLEYGLVGTKSQPASCSREFSNAQIFECLKSGISFVSTPMVLTGPN